MDHPIFDRISEQYQIEIRSKSISGDHPVLFSGDEKICYIDPHHTLEEQVYYIFEYYAARQYDGVEFESPRQRKHRISDRTRQLLLPTRDLTPVKDKTLPELKKLFPHCSLPTIALRLLDCKRMILTVWQNYKLKMRRASNQLSADTPIHFFENECMEYAYKHRSSSRRKHENEGLVCGAYYINDKPRSHYVYLTTEPIPVLRTHAL